MQSRFVIFGVVLMVYTVAAGDGNIFSLCGRVHTPPDTRTTVVVTVTKREARARDCFDEV